MGRGRRKEHVATKTIQRRVDNGQEKQMIGMKGKKNTRAHGSRDRNEREQEHRNTWSHRRVTKMDRESNKMQDN